MPRSIILVGYVSGVKTIQSTHTKTHTLYKNLIQFNFIQLVLVTERLTLGGKSGGPDVRRLARPFSFSIRK